MGALPVSLEPLGPESHNRKHNEEIACEQTRHFRNAGPRGLFASVLVAAPFVFRGVLSGLRPVWHRIGYDWNTMRRLGRRGADVDVKTASAQQQTVRWMPRARRIRLFRPLRYRDITAELWCDGELKNISKSGVLFAGSCPIPEGARIELEMEMLVEICGSPARRVKCIAHVVRTGAGRTANVFAAQILDYLFVGADLRNA
jgi:hypothetical protein